LVYKSSLQGAIQLIAPSERGGSISQSGQPISKGLAIASKADSKKTIAPQEKPATAAPGGAGSSEPFKFEFDPSEFLEQTK
jgi:hypothetical protein